MKEDKPGCANSRNRWTSLYTPPQETINTRVRSITTFLSLFFVCLLVRLFVCLFICLFCCNTYCMRIIVINQNCWRKFDHARRGMSEFVFLFLVRFQFLSLFPVVKYLLILTITWNDDLQQLQERVLHTHSCPNEWHAWRQTDFHKKQRLWLKIDGLIRANIIATFFFRCKCEKH